MAEGRFKSKKRLGSHPEIPTRKREDVANERLAGPSSEMSRPLFPWRSPRFTHGVYVGAALGRGLWVSHGPGASTFTVPWTVYPPLGVAKPSSLGGSAPCVTCSVPTSPIWHSLWANDCLWLPLNGGGLWGPPSGLVAQSRFWESEPQAWGRGKVARLLGIAVSPGFSSWAASSPSRRLPELMSNGRD